MKYIIALLIFGSTISGYAQVLPNLRFEEKSHDATGASIKATDPTRFKQALDSIRVLRDSLAKIITAKLQRESGKAPSRAKANRKAMQAYRIQNRKSMRTAGLKFEALALKKRQEIENTFAVEYASKMAEIETQGGDSDELEGDLDRIEKKRDEGIRKDVVPKFDKAKALIYKSRTKDTLALFAVHYAADAQVFYTLSTTNSKAEFLNNSLINFSGSSGKISLFNELYGDYFGPLRFNVGILVTNKSDAETNPEESQEDAIQRLVGGGGNFLTSLSYPWLDFNIDHFGIRSVIVPKFAFDVPALGTEKGEYGYNVDVGIEASMFYSGLLDRVTFFVNYRGGSVRGNEIFYTNLNKPEHKQFSLNQFSLGAGLGGSFKVSWNFYYGGNFVRDNFPNTISFSIIPN